MLVQFMLKNVLSFRDETFLDMAAVNAYKEHEYNLIDEGNEKFLKVLSIYGANASGKSNIHAAMGFFRNIIIESFNNTSDNVGEMKRTAIKSFYIPFAFDGNNENSEFQMIFISEQSEYKYGFEYNDKEIVTEWLYRKNLNTNRTATILERSKDTIKLGPAVRKECEKYKNQLPKETLALSFFNKLNLKTDIFNTVYDHCTGILVMHSWDSESNSLLRDILPDLLSDSSSKARLLQFLSSIDSGIKDLKCINKEKKHEFRTVHMGRDGHNYELDLFDESEGTIKSIIIYMFAQATIYTDRVMFVDELNTKLHPLLLKFIIDLFNDSDSKAQLIYTTHDTTLMDKKFFRRDQIVFVQKDPYGYSELASLSDYRVRSDASFEKDYLAGVYGGIPLLKEFSLKED